jgi:hypothetical protein
LGDAGLAEEGLQTRADVIRFVAGGDDNGQPVWLITGRCLGQQKNAAATIAARIPAMRRNTLLRKQRRIQRH